MNAIHTDKWGIFKCGVQLHIAPATPSRELAKPHVLSKKCSCGPREVKENIIVHEEIN